MMSLRRRPSAGCIKDPAEESFAPSVIAGDRSELAPSECLTYLPYELTCPFTWLHHSSQLLNPAEGRDTG